MDLYCSHIHLGKNLDVSMDGTLQAARLEMYFIMCQVQVSLYISLSNQNLCCRSGIEGCKMSSVRKRRQRGQLRHTTSYPDVQADRSICVVLFLHIVAHTGLRTVRKCKYNE